MNMKGANTMNTKLLLGIALAAAATVAACGDASDPGSLGGADGTGDEAPPRGTGKGTGNGDGTGGGNGTGGGSEPQPNGPAGNATNSTDAQKFFVDTIYPVLKKDCGACHGGAGTGGAPTWVNNTDAIASYKLQFQLGYVVVNSRMVLKTAHGGGTTNELKPVDKGNFNKWVDMETKAGGTKATPNVMEKLGGCFSEQLFNQINMQQITTTRRQNENANNCTGCDNAPCRTCHAGGEADFVAAQGVSTAILPANHTFNETKKMPFISKFFGISPTGEPIASDALVKKSDATKTAKPYTHPQYTLNEQRITAIKAFTDDAIAKYKAGTCTPTP